MSGRQTSVEDLRGMATVNQVIGLRRNQKCDCETKVIPECVEVSLEANALICMVVSVEMKKSS